MHSLAAGANMQHATTCAAAWSGHKSPTDPKSAFADVYKLGTLSVVVSLPPLSVALAQTTDKHTHIHTHILALVVALIMHKAGE